MRFPSQSGDPTLGRALWAVLRSDPWARSALVLFALWPALFLLPRSLELRAALTRDVLPSALLGLAVLALCSGLRRIGRQEERHFWREIAVAYGAWLLAELLFAVFDEDARTLAFNTTVELLYAIYYVALLLALERQPHRGRWRPSGLEGMLVRPVLVAFILSLFAYFIFIPVSIEPEIYATFLPSLNLYVLLDAFVATKLLLLTRAAQGSRWRALYALLSTASLATLFADLLEALSYADPAWESEMAMQALWCVAYAAVALAARLRHHPFPPEPARETTPASFLSGPAAETLLFTLALPWVHLAGYSFGLFEDPGHDDRELLVLGSTLLLGGVAIVQQDLFRRRSRELALQRIQIETNLRKSEADMRLVSARRRSAGELREAEERFATIFRLSPSGLLLFRLDGGRLIEVNDRYRELSGRAGELTEKSLAGRSLADLGLGDRDFARRLCWRLSAEGRVRGLEGELHTLAGSRRPVTISADALEIDGEACALVVVRADDGRERSA